MVVTWSDLAKHCPWSKGQPIGNGIYCAPWHSASSYPIPPIGEWDLVFVWFHLRYYYYYPIPPEGNGILLLCGFILAIIIIGVVVVKVNSVAVKLGQISLFFEAISMKLGGHIGHGANSSYHHF